MLSSRAVQFSTKTPARTKQRAENAHAYPTTVLNGKINAARTPFQPKTAQPQRILKEIVVKGTNTTTRNRPLADKTPFANRVLESTPQLLFTKPQHDSGGSARASSTRKHPRAPNNAAKKNFQTPANNGNHWDVSDGEIIVPELGPSEAEVVEEDLDDNDPIEYMPPNTTNIAYNPPFDFDLPNYSQLGSQVLRTVYSYPAVEGPPPSFEFEIKENEFGKWNELTSILPPLPESPPPTRPGTRLRSTMGRVTSLSSRPASTLTRSTTATFIRSKAVVGTNTRPATSAGTRAPIAKPTPTLTTRAPLTSRTTPTATATTRKPLTKTTTSVKPVTKLPSTTTRPVVSRTTLSKLAKPTPTTATITTRKPMTTKSTIVKPTPTSRPPLSIPTKKAMTPSSRMTNLKPRTQVQQPQPTVASSSTTRRPTVKGVAPPPPPPPSTRGVIKGSGSTLAVPVPGLKKMNGSVMVRKKNVTSSLSSLGGSSLQDKNKNKDDEEKDSDNDNDEKGTVAVESENKFDINRLQEIQDEDGDEDEVSMKMEYQHQHQYLEFIREVEFGGCDDDEEDDGEVIKEMDREMNNDNGDGDGDVSVVIDYGGGNGSGSEVESLIEEKELDEDGVLFGMDEEAVEDKVVKVEVKVEDVEEAQDQGQVQMKEVEPEFVEVEDVERVKAVESIETVKAVDEVEDVEEIGDVKTVEEFKEVKEVEVEEVIEEEISLVNEVGEQALSVVQVPPQPQQLEELKEEEVHQCEVEVGTGVSDKHLESEIEKRVENHVDGKDLSLDGDLDLDVFIDNSLSEKLVELELST